MLFLLTIISLVCAVVGLGGIDTCPVREGYFYGFSGSMAPEHWADLSEADVNCNGTKQSPIDISYINSTSQYSGLSFIGYDKPLAGIVDNNGLTILFIPLDEVERFVSWNGENYGLSFMYFTFSNAKDNGTQHAIDGRKYAMELNIIHASSGGNIAVTVLYEEGPDENERLEDLIAIVNTVQYKSSTTEEFKELSLFDLLDEDCYGSAVTEKSQPTYMYDGSFAVPHCYEVVTYAIFSKPVKIQTEQMEIFRNLYASEEGSDEPCMMYNNIRPLQAKNGRAIKTSSALCKDESN